MAKYKKRGLRLRYIFALLIGAVLHGISTAVLKELFYCLQTGLFADEGDLIFLHSSMTNYIIPVGLAFVFIVIWMMVVSGDRGFPLPKGKLDYIYVALIFLALTLATSFTDMFNHTIIKNDGLYIKSGIFSSQEHIGWNSVDSVNIFYEHSEQRSTKNDFYYRYKLALNDGRIIDMEWAEDFKKWDRVIFMDNYFKQIGLRVNIVDIDGDILERIKPLYNSMYGEHTEEVIKTVFNYRD